jgi:hypothetical protein
MPFKIKVKELKILQITLERNAKLSKIYRIGCNATKTVLIEDKALR